MAKSINPTWANNISIDIKQGKEIDETISYNPAMQFLIKILTNHNRPFKLYSLGAGVKRITTNTTTCPCCKKKLEE